MLDMSWFIGFLKAGKMDGSIKGLLNRFGAGLSRVDGFGGRRDWAFLWRAAAPPPWTAALGAHGAARRSR